jgi:sugar phosphate isomerase/epimerase
MLYPCVFTDEISQDLEHALAVAAEFGVCAVELRGVWGKGIVEHTDEEVRRARELIAARGFSVASIATGFFKCDLPGFQGRVSKDEETAAAIVAQHVDMLRRGVELCHTFGAPVVRGFAFWRPSRRIVAGAAGGGVGGGIDPGAWPPHAPSLAQDTAAPPNRHLRQADVAAEAWRRILDAFAEAVRIVESAEVTFGLENEHDCGVATGEEAAKFLADLGSPNVKIAWDAGNAFFAGETPYPDGYERIRGRIAHVHVKDAAVDTATGAARWTVMGAGQVDWQGQFRALIADGYDGAVSLETHYTPLGGTREDGSRQCLDAMMKLLREAGWQGQ